MPYRVKRMLVRILALGLSTTLLAVDALAAIKEVEVFGARSINDQGLSDNRVTMSELRDDYSDFDQSDALREYFHKDQEAPKKTDLPESVSWLIDNEIYNRDQRVSVTNFSMNREAVPVVSITKANMDELLSKVVRRSDAIMYIYKAVFGPIDARTVGIETENVRVDDGANKTLYKMFLDHEYFKTLNSPPASINQQQSSSGTFDVDQIYKETHYPDGTMTIDKNQYVTGVGGGAGSQQVGVSPINPAAEWRYTPQGDVYDSMFGDTNIFISDLDINQQVNTGKGQQSSTITDMESAQIPGEVRTSTDTGSYETKVEHREMGVANVQDTEIGGTGGANAAIAVEMDYKQMYFTTGADLLFYRTNDVIELYIKNALSKGLLNYQSELRTKKFKDTFTPEVPSQKLETWNPLVPAFISNRRVNVLRTSSNVNYAPTKETLGVNFDLNSQTNSFTLNRLNLFESNTGYFEDEHITRMDLYHLIYDFLGANEKKISELEAEIVTYKYGLTLEGMTVNDDDKKVLMNLIAQGIIDFDRATDLSNLYFVVNYADFSDILYRVANPNARLNFSRIQLTDSDNYWKAKGFSAVEYYVTDDRLPGPQTIEYNPLLFTDPDDDGEAEYTEVATLNKEDYLAEVSYASTGEIVSTTQTAERIIDIVDTQSIKFEDGTNISSVYLGDNTVATITTPITLEGLRTVSLDLRGLDFVKNPSATSEYGKYIKNYREASNTESQYAINTMISQTDGQKIAVNLWLMMAVKNNLVPSEPANEKFWTLVRGNAEKLTSFSVKWYQTTGTSQPNEANNLSLLPDIQTLVGRLVSIDFVYDGQEHHLVAPDTFDSSDKSVTELNSRPVVDVTSVTTEEDIMGQGYSQGVAQRVIATVRETGATSSVGAATSSSNKLETWQNNGMTYVSYNSILAAGLPIERQSDVYYTNTKTGSLLYINDSHVMVGTTYMKAPGPAAEKMENNIYLWIDAVKLLIDAQQEAATLNGTSFVGTPSASIVNQTAINYMPITSTSGAFSGNVAFTYAYLGDYDTVSAKEPYGSSPNNTAQQTYGVSAPYLALNLANKAGNVMFKYYSYQSNGVNKVAYAVVRLRPYEAGAGIVFPTISKDSSVEDMLNLAVQEPTDPASAQAWNQNKNACNEVFNWFYQTSGELYITTGYCKPEVIIYLENGEMSQGGASSFVSGVKGVAPTVKNFMPQTTSGILEKQVSLKTSGSDSYSVAEDYSAILANSRIYLHQDMFTNLVLNGSSFTLKDSSVAPWTFTAGQNFKIKFGRNIINTYSGGSSRTPYAGTSLASFITSDSNHALITSVINSEVTALVGPILGSPRVDGGKLKFLTTKSSGDIDMLPPFMSAINGAESEVRVDTVNPPIATSLSKVNSLVNRFGNADTPYLIKGDSGTYNVVAFNEDGSSKTTTPVASNKNKEVGLFLEIKFNASEYHIDNNGYLIHSPPTIDQFISPEMLTNMNDLIINRMLDVARDRIPVNQVPAGAILRIGDSWYMSKGTDNAREFVGLAKYPGTFADSATALEKLAPRFTSEYIYAGSQLVNVVAFFKSICILPFAGAEGAPAKTYADRAGEITKLLNTTIYAPKGKYVIKMSSDPEGGARLSDIEGSFAGGSVPSLVTEGTIGASSGTPVSFADKLQDITVKQYSPISIEFQEGLYAYTEGTKIKMGTQELDIYYISNIADSAISGAFDELDLFSDSILTETLNEVTTTALSASFKAGDATSAFMYAFQQQFQDAFKGDMFTLARLLMFVTIVWLFVASWICFGCYRGRLMPFIESIKNPMRNGGAKGIDLFKVVSLGTISVETDFRFTKFLIYDLILAVLMLIVWKSGNITF